MHLLRFLKIVWREFNKNTCMQRASAMAYVTLLSLVPLITVVFSFFTNFIEFTQLKSKIKIRLLTHLMPASCHEVTRIISDYIDQFTQNTATVSIFGVIALALTTLALFNTVENSFNYIWNVTKKRSIIQKYNAYSGILLGLPILIGLSFYITSLFKIRLMQMQYGFEAIDRLFFICTPFLLSWMAFIISYKVIPHTKVRWKYAVVGGIFGGTLWEIAKIVFGYYTTHVVNYNLIYGSLGTVPLFLGWLYLTWVIVLLGIQVVCCLQQYRELSEPCDPANSKQGEREQ
ncbi:MAG TPA: YhjD/YihY/BrkB family envelope integrity protein [bacterium]|nr:YhjD/YihY/BrkB family envelope integrity protein [bacterium]